MKKLISLLIIFATITIACMTSVMASFAVQDTAITKEKEIVVSNMCCEGGRQEVEQKSDVLCDDLGICSDGSICECCFTPSQNYPYLTIADNTSVKKKLKKIKILDFSFMDLLQDTLNVNLVAKLNSPPNLSEPFILSNLYIALIGNVKSNC